jgi:predicted phage-related endonuclease
MFAGFRVEIFEIPWDDDAAADWVYMLDKAHTFWNEHILTGRPPALDDHEATTAALTEVHGLDPEGIIDADGDARQLVTMLAFAKLQTKAAEAEEARLSNEVRALLGDHTDLVDGVKPGKRKDTFVPNVIASWRPQESRRLDTTALRNAEPIIADKFTTTTQTRVLRVASLKEPAQ